MELNKPINPQALAQLKAYKGWLSNQQYKTLRGQVLAGDDIGAMKGLQKLIKKSQKRSQRNGRKNLH